MHYLEYRDSHVKSMTMNLIKRYIYIYIVCRVSTQCKLPYAVRSYILYIDLYEQNGCNLHCELTQPSIYRIYFDISYILDQTHLYTIYRTTIVSSVKNIALGFASGYIFPRIHFQVLYLVYK